MTERTAPMADPDDDFNEPMPPYLRGLWQGALIGLIFGALLVWGVMR